MVAISFGYSASLLFAIDKCAVRSIKKEGFIPYGITFPCRTALANRLAELGGKGAVCADREGRGRVFLCHYPSCDSGLADMRTIGRQKRCSEPIDWSFLNSAL